MATTPDTNRTLYRVLRKSSLLAATAITVTLGAGISVPVFAQDQAATSGLDEIIVTGTRRIDRTVSDSPVPIDVVSFAALEKSGLGEINKMLNALVP